MVLRGGPSNSTCVMSVYLCRRQELPLAHQGRVQPHLPGVPTAAWILRLLQPPKPLSQHPGFDVCSVRPDFIRRSPPIH